MRWDVVVVGAGFAGVVAAERFASKGSKVLVIERRSHIGGNSYDYYNSQGILVHLYGPHIFHTKDKGVWDYLSRFTKWRLYSHKVQAYIEGKKVPLPFNLNTLDALFPSSFASALGNKLISEFGYGARVPVLEMLENEDKDIRFLAEYVYENVFLNYSIKQWGLKPEEMDPRVTARVPVLVGRDDRYFHDPFQGIPASGYTRMFENMLRSPNISVMLNTDYKGMISTLSFGRLVYTGPIDYFFDFKHGVLPYRSMRFDFETLDLDRFQDVAVVNYPNDYGFTRVTEFKHLTGQRHKGTTILKEFPEDFKMGKNVPCYPIQTDKNLLTYEKYKKEADSLDNVIFLGRLAEYRYYNMDEVVKEALDRCIYR